MSTRLYQSTLPIIVSDSSQMCDHSTQTHTHTPYKHTVHGTWCVNVQLSIKSHVLVSPARFHEAVMKLYSTFSPNEWPCEFSAHICWETRWLWRSIIHERDKSAKPWNLLSNSQLKKFCSLCTWSRHRSFYLHSGNPKQKGNARIRCFSQYDHGLSNNLGSFLFVLVLFVLTLLLLA